MCEAGMRGDTGPAPEGRDRSLRPATVAVERLTMSRSGISFGQSSPAPARLAAPGLTHIVSDIIQLVRDKRPEILPIFRSRHQLALLGALYINAGKSFSIADLARANRIPQATVSREVSRLAKAGLVNT